MNKYAIYSKGCEDSNFIEETIKNNINLKYDDINPDILFVIGGDGTILRAFHKYKDIIDKITIFGIHTGHLGFLANYEKDDVNIIIDILNGNKDYKVEEQTLLEFKISNAKDIIEGLALNEVSLTANPNMIQLNVEIDNTLLETFRGGGLCISTPLGSTGYNKSLSGSVIDHNIDCLQIAEIAGINSNSYKTLMNPLVLSSNRNIVMNNIGDKEVLFTYDNNSIRLNEFDSLTVKSSLKKVKFAYIQDVNFVKRVNKAFL